MRHEFKFAFGLVILGIIFLFAFCPVGKSDPHTLNRWPANTVIVDAEGLEGVKTITAAYNIAAAGDEILIYPGTYTESLLIISKAVTFTGMGGNDTSVVWQGDSLLWSLQTDGVVFNNIYFKA